MPTTNTSQKLKVQIAISLKLNSAGLPISENFLGRGLYIWILWVRENHNIQNPKNEPLNRFIT